MWLRSLCIILYCIILSVENSHAQLSRSLEECIAYALEQSLDMRYKEVEMEIKDQDRLMARKDRLPGVNGYTNLYSNFGHSQDVFGTIQRNDNLNSSMGITADIMLYNFGVSKNNMRKATLEKDALNFEKEALKREITIQVTKAYLEMTLQNALVEVLDSAVLHADKLLIRATRTNDVGTVPLVDVYEARASLAREKQKREAAKVDWERARLKLAQLMRLTDEELLIIEQPIGLNIASTMELNRDFVIQDVLSQHPALMRYSTLVEGLNVERQLVRAQLYPTLKGSASVGSTYFNPLRSTNNNGFFRQAKDNFAQQVALTVNIPIFNKGRTRLQLKQIELQKRQVDLNHLKEKQGVEEQVKQIYLDFISNKQQYRSSEEVMIQTELAARLAQKSYEAGRSSIYDYNNSRQNFIQAQSDWIRAGYSVMFSYKMLKFQMTGDYRE